MEIEAAAGAPRLVPRRIRESGRACRVDCPVLRMLLVRCPTAEVWYPVRCQDVRMSGLSAKLILEFRYLGFRFPTS